MEEANQTAPDSNGTMAAPAVADEKAGSAPTVDDCFAQLALIFQRAQTSVAWQKQCVQDVYTMQQTAVAGLQDPVSEFFDDKVLQGVHTTHLPPLEDLNKVFCNRKMHQICVRERSAVGQQEHKGQELGWRRVPASPLRVCFFDHTARFGTLESTGRPLPGMPVSILRNQRHGRGR